MLFSSLSAKIKILKRLKVQFFSSEVYKFIFCKIKIFFVLQKMQQSLKVLQKLKMLRFSIINKCYFIIFEK